MSDDTNTPEIEMDSCDTGACIPKGAEELMREHEAQLNELLVDVEAPDHPVEPKELNFLGLGLGRRDFMKAGMAVGVAGSLAGCGAPGGRDTPTSGGAAGGDAANDVPPGQHDEYYGFWSGGHAGDVRVIGIPSMRELARIPMFQPDSALGYGHDDETRAMLEEAGGYTWGDNHHPVLSETDGDYDGRWLFINDKGNGRMARVNLKYFETDAITQVPHTQAVHGCAVQSPDTTHVYAVSEFRAPIPNDGTADPTDPSQYGSLFTALDPGTMDVQWQIRVSGNMDNADSSKDGAWAFATGYNDEEGFEIEDMSHDDRDYVRAFDVEAIDAAVEAGSVDELDGIPFIDARAGTRYANHPQSGAGSDPLVYYIPVPKSPHGIDVEPTGKYAIANGKLSPTCSLIEISKIKEVSNLEKAVVGQPKVGLGPLHTTFDGRGHAYTTLFIDSQVAKWDIETAASSPKGSEEAILGKIDVHYNPGHIQAAQAETVNPTGDWLVSLNKLSKDRFLPVGPIHPDNDQLIYIGEDTDDARGGMVLVEDVPVHPEPHDAVIAHRDKLDPAVVWDREDYEGVKEYVTEDQSRVERVDDTTVHVYLSAKRSEYGLRDFTVKEGDTVKLVVTNIEGSRDIIHGLAIPQYNVNIATAPQDTREVTFTADKPGVYWAYCTYFCSALHLEMRSRMIVEPRE